jgi:general secretion pathway protein B
MPSVAAPSAAAAAPVPPAAPVAVPSWRERPDLQRELPPIVFGGSVYSEQAPARIVVLNGRVFREGETIMPDLVVDEIRPRGAVLRWRGQRFSLP